MQKKPVVLHSTLTVPTFEPLRLQAILEFLDSTVAVGEVPLAATAMETPGPQLTDVVLSNRFEPAPPATASSDPLRGKDF